MEVLSLGWQTDLALLQLGGSTVEQHPTYAVVRTPHNPRFRWGNFVLLRRAPLRRDAPHVLELLDDAFPEAGHRAFGVDDPEATPSQLTAFAEAGFRVERSTVLTCRQVPMPRALDRSLEIRPLQTDADWDLRVELSLAVYGETSGETYRDFAVRRARAERRLVESGRGDWLGAFEHGRLVSSVGVVRTTRGSARYQQVETDPGYRGRGLAGTLIHLAGRQASQSWAPRRW